MARVTAAFLQPTRTRWFRRAQIVWPVFAVVSFWLAVSGYFGESVPYGDVSYVYSFWAETATNGGAIVGIDTMWVYPILAFVPMLLAGVFGTHAYPFAWITLVTLLNFLALRILAGSFRKPVQRVWAVWWWMAFLLALGPISVARIDSVVSPLAIIGLLFLLTRPALAGTLLTVGAWIKVWPAAFVIAVIAFGRNRLRVLLSAVVTSVTVIVIALILGSGMNVFSFLYEQSARGLQIEAPAATPYMWLAMLQVPGFSVYYDRNLLTFQVAGSSTAEVASLSTYVMAFAILAIFVVAWIVYRKGARSFRLLPALMLALVTMLIFFNKVGSPQYIVWFAAPIILGLVVDRTRFTAPALYGLVIAVLTQLFYPYQYMELLTLNPLFVVFLTMRNAFVLILLGYSVWLVATSARGSRAGAPARHQRLQTR